MPTDGLARYDHLPGSELVLELETMDRSKFPLNYYTLVREIAARKPSAAPDVQDRHVATFDSLPTLERRMLLRTCMWKVFILMLQYSVVGGVLSAVLVEIVAEVLKTNGMGWAADSAKALLVLMLVALNFATYWAFLRWLLHENISGVSFALLRDGVEDPNNRLEPQRRG